MSIRLMSKVFDNHELLPAGKLVMLAMADYASDSGDSIFPSVATLAHKTSLSERTVQRCIRGLEEWGFLTMVKEGGGRKSTNLYKINVERLDDVNGDQSAEMLKGDTVSRKGDTVSRKGDTVTPDSSLITNESPSAALPLKDPNSDEELERILGQKPKTQLVHPPRSAAEYKADLLASLAAGHIHSQKQKEAGEFDCQHFPPDVRATIERVTGLWHIEPPTSKESRFSFWVKSARELQRVYGEKGIDILQDVHDEWVQSMYTVSGPSSLVNAVVALVGRKRAYVAPNAPATKNEELGYRWNSDLDQEENERRLRESQIKPKETDGR